MSKKRQSKSEEPDEEKKHSPWSNKNYQHAAGEIEALRAMLKRRKKDGSRLKDGKNTKSDKDKNED